MSLFAYSAATQTTAVSSGSAAEVFNTSASGIPTGVTLYNVTLLNTGSVACYVGQSAVTASTGLLLPAGGQLTYNGYAEAQGASAGNIYAITSSGSTTVLAGLATVASNV